MENKNEWLVSDKHCKGCMYYCYLSSHHWGNRFCAYTYYTGKVRKNPPCRCEVKKKGKRPRIYSSTTGIIPIKRRS